jgi:site-specific recombinase XerD
MRSLDERTERQSGPEGCLPHYTSLMVTLRRWAAAKEIEFVQEITPLQLERWYSSPDWLRYAETTRQQRWGVLRSMFRFLVERDVIETSPIAAIRPIRPKGEHFRGPYTDEQIGRLFAAIKDTIPPSAPVLEQQVYAQRLTAFVSLLHFAWA